eukprot:scaffold2639_cov361-Pavlova_lutheri.AAC.54
MRHQFTSLVQDLVQPEGWVVMRQGRLQPTGRPSRSSGTVRCDALDLPGAIQRRPWVRLLGPLGGHPSSAARASPSTWQRNPPPGDRAVALVPRRGPTREGLRPPPLLPTRSRPVHPFPFEPERVPFRRPSSTGVDPLRPAVSMGWVARLQCSSFQKRAERAIEAPLSSTACIASNWKDATWKTPFRGGIRSGNHTWESKD